ncbi:MAG: tetratricopeptide repeat protein, partial [Aquisalimonadaceae bacterium]
QTLAGVHHQQGETDKAVALLRRAVGYEPRELQPRLALARYLQELGDLEAAVEQAGQAVRYAPRNFEALGLLGLLQLQAGDNDAALGTARRLQQLENGMDIGAMLEGRAWAEQGNMEAAVQAYQRAADRGRRDALGPLVAGRADLGMDNPARPLEAWIESNPDDGGARVSLAQWHAERGDYAAAAVQYEALVELTSRRNPAMLNNLAWTYQQMDDGRALAVAREAHALAPDNAAIKDTVGWIELQAGNWQQALTLLAEAVEAAPEDRTFRFHYAAALAQSGREEDARRQLAPVLADDAPFQGREDAVKLLDSLR